jgi:hypothetical protein
MLIRGVRWDENFEFAQAKIGAVPYDDAHPLRQYTLAAYNIQFYSSALILKINDDPVFLCGFRSLLFILATVLPVFMLGAWISLRTWIGHAAAVFILMGVHLEFDGVYPQFIWPGMFSNGHVGMGYVLIFAGALAAGHLRIAGLLLGLMPAVHLGQMPPAALLAIGYAVRWFCAGIAFCLVFYVVQQQFVLPPVTVGPYFSESDIDAVWQGRISSGRDMHRSLPSGNIHLVTVATPIVSIGGRRLLRRRESDLETPWFWLTVYTHCVILISYTTMALHHLILYQIAPASILLVAVTSALFSGMCWFVFENHRSPSTRQRVILTAISAVFACAVLGIGVKAGGEIPYLLLGWLPYRLMNHLAPLLLVMGITLVGEVATAQSERSNFVPFLLPAFLLFDLGKPLYSMVFGESIYPRYLFHNDSVFFAVVGAAVSILLYDFRGDKYVSIVFAGMIVVATGALAIVHQFGAACFVAGGLGAFVVLRSPLTLPRAGARIAAYALGALVLVATMENEYGYRRHLPIGDFESEVARILDAEGKPDALVAARPDQILFQAQTSHPMISDMATEFHASYRPSLGPSVQKLYEDVYGIWFEERDSMPPSWKSVWNERTPSEWSALSALYDFEYLVVPNDVRPQETLVLRGELDSLYRIP